MGGMVLETSLQEIVSRFHEQQKIAKSEVREKTINIFINIYLRLVSCMFKNVSSQVSIIPTQLSSKLSKIGPMPRFGFMKWINQSLLFKLLFILHAKLILERHPRDVSSTWFMNFHDNRYFQTPITHLVAHKENNSQLLKIR